MTICREHEMSFWMDIHGELDPEDRRLWETHVTGCDACRMEKVRARQMMCRVKSALAPPALPDAAIDAAVKRITSTSRKQVASRPSHRPSWFAPRVMLPTLVTVCLLLIAIGFFSFNRFAPDTGQPGRPVAHLKETLQKDDIEVIENMDLLEEFETIQQLVQMMEDQHNSSNMDEEIHGEANPKRNLLYG